MTENDFQPKPLTAGDKINLLLVGKEYHRKGVDIAIETIRGLNALGIPAELRIVGQENENSENITFMGLLSKKDPDQLQAYLDNYRWAHFLLFPSRFDAAGIVPSEAAGFGVPTITNAAGGIQTTVKNRISGIVLPKAQPCNGVYPGAAILPAKPQGIRCSCENQLMPAIYPN